MAFRVEITPFAEQDILLILDWLIEQHASRSGQRWFEGLQNAIASLERMPRLVALRLQAE